MMRSSALAASVSPVSRTSEPRFCMWRMKSVASAARHDDLDSVQRMRAVVVEIMGQLLLGQLDTRGRRQRFA